MAVSIDNSMSSLKRLSPFQFLPALRAFLVQPHKPFVNLGFAPTTDKRFHASSFGFDSLFDVFPLSCPVIFHQPASDFLRCHIVEQNMVNFVVSVSHNSDVVWVVCSVPRNWDYVVFGWFISSVLLHEKLLEV